MWASNSRAYLWRLLASLCHPTVRLRESFRVPNAATQERERATGDKEKECVYSPHSRRATTATLLLDSSLPIESVQDLLDHKQITTTQIYDKRRRSVRDSASHKVPI